ncbi:unnamed protein product [Camellia sinensis]
MDVQIHKKLSFLSSSTSSLNMFFPHIFTSLILFIYLATFASAATLLPLDEVEALKQIGKTLGKYDWNFSGGADPCSWAEGTDNNVTCNCSSSTLCHITMISLKSQNLPGTLPTEFVKLPFLKVIDLTRNYLNGTIPPQWGSLQQVTHIGSWRILGKQKPSLLGNRLTGSIPKEIGNISTLRHITLEFNQLSGTLPPELGNLSQINDITFDIKLFYWGASGNTCKADHFDGILVGTNLLERYPFSSKNGQISRNWIQASGLDGPIPQEIASLTKMTDLRISDLNGMEATFPLLNSMTNMNRLILRSCNITGPLPNYLANLTKLKTLDLSFNKLNGEIPSNFVNLSTVEFIFLTGNCLSGPVPDWILKHGINITSVDSEVIGVAAIRQPLRRSSERRSVTRTLSNACAQSSLLIFHITTLALGLQVVNRRLNLFASSSNDNLSQVSKPLGIGWSSFYINCGGKETFNGSTKYEDDLDLGGPAKFVQHGTNWAFSTTGLFLDDNSVDSLISTNTSRLSMRNFELYMDARLSPTSLTYYGFCLINGNYTVKLHFAEIMFTNDETFSSLGRRIFDIYIQEGLPMQNHDLLRKLLQGKLERKDFNIEKAAGGVGKETIQTFTTVVTNSTLEIRLYWAGQGTTGMPRRGVYGPLISAISVYNPDYLRQLSKNRNNISVGVVLGIVAAVAFVMILLVGILWWRCCLPCKETTEHE